MQLSDIRTAVRAVYGIAANEGNASDTALNELINAALREVTLQYEWHWNEATETITTVAGTASYSRNAACRKTIRVVDTVNGRQLLQASPKWVTRWRNVDGTPVYWWIEDESLYFAPKPAEAKGYLHVYQATETALSLDTDEPSLPDWATDLLIARAVVKLAQRLGDTTKMRMAQMEEEKAQDRMVDDVRGVDGPPRRQGRRDWTRFHF